MAIVAAGHGHSALMVLFAPLVAAFDALLGEVSDDVGWRFLVATRCFLPTSLCRVKHGLIIAGGVLGGDVMQFLKRAYEKVIISTLPRALRAVFR
jgi:hypothetical protein